MNNKPLHQWQYKGKHYEYEGNKAPEDMKDSFCDTFECSSCGFALISYVSEPPARAMQRLIGHNSQLKTCKPKQKQETQ